MASKDEIRKRRDSAMSITLGIEANDKIVETISRADGLYSITLEKIIRVNLPDDIDPNMEHANAPIAQTLIVRQGSRNPIVARTVLQAKDFSQFIRSLEVQTGVQDIAWEVMLSLLGLDSMIKQLENSIETKIAEISERYSSYVSGYSPPPPPIVEGLEIEFRALVLIGNHTLNAISELFSFILGGSFRRGRFDLILNWLKEKYGSNDILFVMLEGNHAWINLWGEVRNAFEHPKKDYYVKVNNFCLMPNRQLQLPTWQMIHPKLDDVVRPQNMIVTLSLLGDNTLRFFEDLLVVLIDKLVKLPMPIGVMDRKEADRNPDCPKRYEITFVLPTTK